MYKIIMEIKKNTYLYISCINLLFIYINNIPVKKPAILVYLSISKWWDLQNTCNIIFQNDLTERMLKHKGAQETLLVCAHA